MATQSDRTCETQLRDVAAAPSVLGPAKVGEAALARIMRLAAADMVIPLYRKQRETALFGCASEQGKAHVAFTWHC